MLVAHAMSLERHFITNGPLTSIRRLHTEAVLEADAAVVWLL